MNTAHTVGCPNLRDSRATCLCMLPFSLFPVDAPDVPSLWRYYGNQMGMEELKAIYGDNWPPEAVRPGESVWYTLGGGESGTKLGSWLSLTQDQFDSKHYYMARGVFPDAHGQGLGKCLRAHAESIVQAADGEALSIWVHTNNEQHYESVRKDPYWEVTGMMFEPHAVMFTHYLK